MTLAAGNNPIAVRTFFPDMLMAVDAPAAQTVVQAGMEIEGFGWAMAGTAIAQVTIEIGRRPLCHAQIGIERPDLRAAFPSYPDAGKAGFHFKARMDSPISGAADMLVTATSVDGRTLQHSVPLMLLSGASERIPDHGPFSHLDEATLDASGELYVFGWAIAASGIDRISILLDGTEVSAALLNLERSDIAQLYAQVKGSDRAGFGLRKRLPGTFAGDHEVTIVIHENGGAERRLSRLVTVTPPEVAPDGADEMIKIAIDLPVLPSDGRPLPVTGNLVVQGWALARAAVERITIAVDGTDAGVAYYGVRREDVAAIFTDWQNSLHCGFGMSIPAKMLRPGPHQIRLTVLDRAGTTLQHSFAIQVEESTKRGPHEDIRRFMSGAEVLLDELILDSLDWRPHFECLLHVGSDDLNLRDLRATLASLELQEYERWHARLVFAAHAAESSAREKILDGLRSDFPRIAQKMSMATGESMPGLSDDPSRMNCTFIAWLRPGDRLGCDALLEMSLHTGLDRRLDFVYADDRRIDPTSGASAAWCKPQWSPDLLMSVNYIGRSWIARAALVARAGEGWLGTRPWSDSYEWVLALTDAAEHIGNVAKILWDTTACGVEDDACAIAALSRTLQSRGIAGETIASPVPGVFRVKRALVRPTLVSIVIPTRGTRGLIKTCISSIREFTRGLPIEIICVENIPLHETELRAWLDANADRTVTAEEPFNWSRFNNAAAAAADPRADYFLFLNDDVEAIQPGWLEALLEHAQREEVGVVGPLLLYPDRRVQHAGMFMVELGRARHAFRFAQADEPGPFGLAQTQRDVLSVTGACMLMRRAVFESTGRFDEAHRVVNNDLDFCLRCHSAGRRVIYTPHARLVHHEMASRSSADDVYDEVHFKRTWGAICAAGDPFYSRALSLDADDSSVDEEPIEVIFGGHPLMSKKRVLSILAMKIDHIGDFITALPALRRLRHHFPAARLCLMAASGSVKLAALEPCVDDIIEFNFFDARSSLGQLTLTADDLAALQRRLAPYRFDLAVDLRKHPDSRKLLRESGARVLAGFDFQGRFPWLDIAVEWDGDTPLVPKRQHVSDDLLRLVDAVGTSCDPERPTIGSDRQASWAHTPLDVLPEKLFSKPVVCIHAASGNPVRQWPEAHFAELVGMILREFDVNVCLIGGLDEELAIRRIWQMNDRHPAIHPLAGILPLRELPHLLSRCALFVGNNSGPQHIAAGLGVPTIGVHSGVVDAIEWAPVGAASLAIRRNMSCSPCYLALPEYCPRDLACVKTLWPRAVFELCRQLLAIRHRRP